MEDQIAAQLLLRVQEHRHYFETFQEGVIARFRRDPRLNGCPPVLHSIRARMKSEQSLRQKFDRKHTDGNPITVENLFSRVTDIAGVRVLHLFQEDFSAIHECVTDQVRRGDWVLAEPPKAYTWDPESSAFFEGFGLNVEVKETFYTSIHYVVRPRADSEVACEIQARTLFEEIWGEIDHQINYPVPTTSLACREQLRVLARLVGAGSRLADAIYRTDREAKGAV